MRLSTSLQARPGGGRSRLSSARCPAGGVELGEDPGTTLVVKPLANVLLLSGIAVLGEVVATAQAAGLDEDFLR